jgi:hypothetical protein
MTRNKNQIATRSSYQIHFKNKDMDFYLMWALANESHEGASYGEAMYVASRIKENDPVSWVNEWLALGRRCEERADKALSMGHKVSARQAFLHAYTYYRIGIHGMRIYDTRRTETYHKFVSCFRKGTSLLETPVESIQVPWKLRGDDVYLPGYFMCPDDSGAKRPTVIIINGGEMYPEDQYFWGGAEALLRGYNVLTIAYDASMAVPILYPDWGPLEVEEAMKPPGLHAHIVDYALSRPETDPEHLAGFGLSAGGYQIAHQASFDNRLKAVILAAPLYDIYAMLSDEIPEAMQNAPSFIMKALTAFATAVNPFTKVALESAMSLARVDNMHDWMNIAKLIPPVDPRSVTCPCLCLVGEGDAKQEIAQCHSFYENTGASIKDIRVFTREDGASAHCQVDNMSLLAQVAYDWLDHIFNYEYGHD